MGVAGIAADNCAERAHRSTAHRWHLRARTAERTEVLLIAGRHGRASQHNIRPERTSECLLRARDKHVV